MTEDDTFNALIKTPFKEFYVLINLYMKENKLTFYYEVPESFYKRHGWEVEEMYRQWRTQFVY